MSRYQERKGQIRSEATEWQNSFEEYDWTWEDMAEFGAYFEKMGKRYGLLKELRENGII